MTTIHILSINDKVLLTMLYYILYSILNYISLLLHFSFYYNHVNFNSLPAKIPYLTSL